MSAYRSERGRRRGFDDDSDDDSDGSAEPHRGAQWGTAQALPQDPVRKNLAEDAVAGAKHPPEGDAELSNFASLVHSCAHSGHLWKKSSGKSLMGRRNWLRRWFALDITEPALYYSASEGSEAKVRESLGRLRRLLDKGKPIAGHHSTAGLKD